MKAFRFRGARLLDWRRAQSDRARIEFARASESLREAARLAAEADERCRRATEDYHGALAVASDPSVLERHRNWIVRQEGTASACRRSHEDRRRAVDHAAEALRLAERRVRVMERLRERALRRHHDAARLAERKDFDHLAALQYARRTRAGGSDDGH